MMRDGSHSPLSSSNNYLELQSTTINNKSYQLNHYGSQVIDQHADDHKSYRVKRSLERIEKEAAAMIGYTEEYRRPKLNIKPLPDV